MRLPSPHDSLIRATFFDITERMRVQKDLAKALDAEHRLNEEQRQFMGLVSHELRTPLAIIDGTAQLLVLSTCRDSECLTHANRILASTKRMSRLIDSCLAEERLCTSGWTPTMTGCNIALLARDSVAQAQAGTTVHAIMCDLEDLPEKYICDQMLVKVMLNNLLDNAVKYSPKGGHIRLSGWRSRDGQIFFEISDEGIGISPEHIGKAFDRFYRTWQLPEIPGAGLGLHIVKRIAELHGGTVTCASKPGHGSTFTVQINSGTSP